MSDAIGCASSKASGEYDVLVAKQLEAWRSAADGTAPQTLLQAYRDEMAQLLADLTAKHKQAVRSAKSARTKLQLHARLVTQWPPGCDALAPLGGEEAYLERLASELAQKSENDELLLNTHGKLGFVRASAPSPTPCAAS